MAHCIERIAFVDSNVLIYAHDPATPVEARTCPGTLAAGSGVEQHGVLSIQVLQEFFVTVTRKLKTPIARAQAREVVRAYAPWVISPTTPETVLRATELSEAAAIDFWDALIVASAEQSARRLSTART